MLVLSRKESERLYIGDNIEIVLIQAQGGRARIGIVAPNDVRVGRHKDWTKEKPEKAAEA